MQTIKLNRETKETQISLGLNMEDNSQIKINTGVPYFDHMLHAMSFHGDFSLNIQANGDLEVDPHHLVEDVGIVLGTALHQYFEDVGAVARYGDCKIPMDDALSEVVIDVCNRPYLLYRVDFPQDRSGDFDMWLLKEFFQGLANSARINLHCLCHYGDNSHHISEALFKALGKAIKKSYKSIKKESGKMSTKGVL